MKLSNTNINVHVVTKNLPQNDKGSVNLIWYKIISITEFVQEDHNSLEWESNNEIIKIHS